MRHSGELSELRLHIGLKGDEGPLVAHLIAIVRRTEDSDTLPVVVDLIAVVLHLVGADQQF